MITHSLARRAGFALLALSLLVAPRFAHAQATANPSPAAIAMAKEILTLKDAVSLYDSVVPNLIDRVREIFLNSNPMIGKDLTEGAIVLRREFIPRTEELRNNLYRLYASHFTEAELRDLVAFYKSPLGQKVIQEEPKVLADSVKATDEWSAKLSDQLIARMREEMKKRGHDL